ncbi:MAG: DNA-binding protein [Leptolyngbya sp.]|nr:DNA-binding protein [Leptolyngbya sp.]
MVCPLLSVDEAAARLGCAPMDLWRLIHAGECPGLIHLGRHYIEAGRLDDVLEVLTRPGLPAT